MSPLDAELADLADDVASLVAELRAVPVDTDADVTGWMDAQDNLERDRLIESLRAELREAAEQHRADKFALNAQADKIERLRKGEA